MSNSKNENGISDIADNKLEMMLAHENEIIRMAKIRRQKIIDEIEARKQQIRITSLTYTSR